MEREDVDSNHSIQFIREILENDCRALIRVTKSAVHGGMYSVITETVSLVHSSLKAFLFSFPFEGNSLSLPFDRQKLHIAMARTCLCYLARPIFADNSKSFQYQRGSRHDAYPGREERLLSYAAVYVFEHVCASGSAGRSDVLLLRDLQTFIDTGANVKTWLAFVMRYNPSAQFLVDYKTLPLAERGDFILPGFGNKFCSWIESLDQSQHAKLRISISAWYQGVIIGES
jgi:hypothetical protein